jgi:hypothetical protein
MDNMSADAKRVSSQMLRLPPAELQKLIEMAQQEMSTALVLHESSKPGSGRTPGKNLKYAHFGLRIGLLNVKNVNWEIQLLPKTYDTFLSQVPNQHVQAGRRPAEEEEVDRPGRREREPKEQLLVGHVR